MSRVSGTVLTKVIDTLNVTCGLNLLRSFFQCSVMCKVAVALFSSVFVWLVGWLVGWLVFCFSFGLLWMRVAKKERSESG